MIRAMLVDDHLLMRQGTRALLATAPDISIVAEAGQAEEALTLAGRLRPDVVLLDIRLKQSSGIDVARTLRHDLPETKVLVLSGYPHEIYARTLLAIGVHGYLLKTAAGTELIDAVRAVCLGEIALGAEIAAQLRRTRRSGLVVTGPLSQRERDVLTLVGQGESNKEIAQTLHLEEKTVESYLGHAMAKLGARSRTDAAMRAVQRGIIAVDDAPGG